MTEKKMERLKEILQDSSYTVAICGSGMMEEGGYIGVKFQERAYDIEKKYGVSPEELFTGSYFNTRPEQFFRFYKNEMLRHMPQKTESWDALAAMERAGKLQCVISANIFSMGKKVGLKNFIELHGSVYQNRCSRCGKEYSMEYVRDSKGIPMCTECEGMIRPQITLFGEMVDSRLITQVTEEIERAEVLLLLGTTLNSEVFGQYIRYFNGKKLVVIHQREHYEDHHADLAIIEQPRKVLPYLGH